MAGEWIGEDNLIHGPFVCQCHAAPGLYDFIALAEEISPERQWLLATAQKVGDLEGELCASCKSRVLDILCPSCLEMLHLEYKSKHQ